MRLLIFISLFLCSIYVSLAQGKATDKRFAIHLGIGSTYGFNSFKQEIPQYHDFKEGRKRSLNSGIGAKFFHRNRWISVYRYYHYAPMYGVSLYHPSIEVASGSFWGRGRNSSSSGGFNNLTIQIGRRKILNQTRWQVSWLAGINSKIVTGRGEGRADFRGTNQFHLEKEDAVYDKGLSLEPQAGYQLAFRGKNIGLALTALGNIGSRYYVSRTYNAWVKNEQYQATVKSKGDFVALILEFEVYLFNRKVNGGVLSN